jgi:hypothetical protein
MSVREAMPSLPNTPLWFGAHLKQSDNFTSFFTHMPLDLPRVYEVTGWDASISRPNLCEY